MDEAIRLDIELALAYSNRGVAYFCSGQPEKAIQDLDEAIHLDPQDALAYANRARANTLLGKDKEAQQDIDRAVVLGFDRGVLDGAIEELKKQR